jgi:hypothetical protein
MATNDLPREELREPSDVTGPLGADAVIRSFNEASETSEELYERAGHARDVAARARAHWEGLQEIARSARGALRTAQLEHPERRAWLPLMIVVALWLLALDSWAAYFAAEALGGDQRVTLLWAALFLVILALFEAGLARYADRNRTVFRLIALGLGLFAALLSILRFGFFEEVGTSPAAAAVAAAVFTVCTVMFVVGGFAAIRHAETPETYQARRRARNAEKKAAAAGALADRCAAERDRRIDAYIGRIRPALLCEHGGAQAMEDKVRAHLTGQRS